MLLYRSQKDIIWIEQCNKEARLAATRPLDMNAFSKSRDACLREYVCEKPNNMQVFIDPRTGAMSFVKPLEALVTTEAQLAERRKTGTAEALTSVTLERGCKLGAGARPRNASTSSEIGAIWKPLTQQSKQVNASFHRPRKMGEVAKFVESCKGTPKPTPGSAGAR